MKTAWVPVLLAVLTLPAWTQDFPAQLRLSAVVATVRITNPAGGRGSGVLIRVKGEQAWILTAAHVVQGTEEAQVEVFTPLSYPRVAKTYRAVPVVGRTDLIRDLALLRLHTRDSLPVPLPLCSKKDAPATNAFVALTVGCSEGDAPAPLAERVAGARRVRRSESRETAWFWEVNQINNEGRSGGAMLNRAGRVIGIASGNAAGKSYYTHLDEIRSFLRSTREPVLEESGDK